jgi:hypothetical protein
MTSLSLIEATRAGSLPEVERILNNGADVNQEDEQGWAALNFAAGRGDLPVVQLLLSRGASLFKMGRDRRTPYMIALAAGRVEVVKFLARAEAEYPGEKPKRAPREYCKAYYIGDLRKYSHWSEQTVHRTAAEGGRDESAIQESVVFVHQDYTVTASMWRNENIIFNDVTPSWVEFCANNLNFSVPNDLDLMVKAEVSG